MRHARPLAFIRHALALLLSLLCIALVNAAHAAEQARDQAVLRITQTEFFHSESATPPADNALWHAQSLPDHWHLTRPGSGGNGWYRVRFTVDAAPQYSWAVYLQRVSMTAGVWLNGTYLGDGGNFEEPIARNWNRPLFFTVPATLLQRGENSLLIRVRSLPSVQGSLAPLAIGPETALRPDYEREFFLRITLNQALTVMIGLVGVLMLSLWWRRRDDSMYGYFGASALVWAINSSNLHVRYVPLPTVQWEILINATFQIFVPLLMVSLLRFLNRRVVWLERGLWFIALAAPLSMELTPDTHLIGVFTLWHFAIMIASVITLLILIQTALRQRNHDNKLLLAALCINVVFGVHDWLVHSKLLPLPTSYTANIHLLHYGAPVFFLFVGWIMTNRFIGALNQLERMNIQLEQRVAQKTVELRHNFEKMRALQNEQAVHEERERIYRDLHDDIGAKLLQLVYRASTPDDAELARSALQDLRDVVSRPSTESFSVDDLLADWRAEADQRLTAAGIQLHWEQADELDVKFLQPHAINLGRILREAISNIIRHAQANNVTLRIARDQSGLVISINDDGIGYDIKSGARGRGVNNMQQRARRIGAAIMWLKSNNGGCCVVVRIPSTHSRLTASCFQPMATALCQRE